MNMITVNMDMDRNTNNKPRTGNTGTSNTTKTGQTHTAKATPSPSSDITAQ